jgi:hypothetical protein
MQSENLRPGSSINTHFLNRLSNQANRGAIQVAGQGISAQDTPGGMVVSLQQGPDTVPDSLIIKCLLVSGIATSTPGNSSVISMGSIVQILQMPTNFNQNFGIACLPNTPGRSDIGVTQDDAMLGSIIDVVFRGATLFAYDPSTIPSSTTGGVLNPSGETLGVPTRMGAQGISGRAMYDLLGPIRFWKDLGQYFGTGNYYAVGEVTGERGDCKLVVDKNGKLYVAKSILWGTNYKVNYSTPGVPQVSGGPSTTTHG